MGDFLNAHKPATSARLHLLLAATMWTVVGIVLLFFGCRWVLARQTHYALLLLAAAVVAGLLKARFVLERTAGHMVERIRTRGDGRCLGGFLSVRSWAFVALMVTAGHLLRGGLLPRTAIGLIYVTVGTALLLGARRLWSAWYNHKVDA
ncbi:MAG: hypothetical protein WBE26_09875 [Phycisphaerae bacterium]